MNIARWKDKGANENKEPKKDDRNTSSPEILEAVRAQEDVDNHYVDDETVEDTEESELEPDDTFEDNADGDESPEEAAYNTDKIVENDNENVQGRIFWSHVHNISLV